MTTHVQAIRRLVVLAMLSLSLFGCGWLGDDQPVEKDPNDYLQAESEPDLQVPADLVSRPDLDPFPVPQIPTQPNPSFYPKKPPLPDALYANDTRNEVRLQRLGSRTWLAVPEPPTTAWPKLKQFFADNGVGFAYEDTSQGRLNTVWLALDADQYRDIVRASLVEAKQEDALSAGKDRLLIRVEQGLQPTATEVHVRHENDLQGVPAADDSVLLNGLTSDSSAAESKLLSEIGAYIAARVAESTVSRVALEIGSGAKTELVRNAAGQPVLRLFLDRGRAWATLGQSLRNAEVVEVSVIQQDSDDASLQIAIPQDLFAGKSGGGLLCRLTFSCGSLNSAVNVTLKMTEGASPDVFDVLVFDGNGPLADNELAQQILVLIREYAA